MPRRPIIWGRWAVYVAAVGALLTLVAILVSGYLAWDAITAQKSEADAAIAEQRDEAKIAHLVEESAAFDEEPLYSERQKLARDRIDARRGVLLPMTYDDSPEELWDVLNECDHLGLLTQRGYLDAHDVWSELGYWLFNIYADAKPVIESDRRGDPDTGRKGEPASMSSCTWLIEQITPIELKEDNGAELNPSQDDINAFYSGEIATPTRIPSRGRRK
jgi:hypothetical protein